MINGDMQFIVPKNSTRLLLCEAAYNLCKGLPKHKIDNFVCLAAKLLNTNEIKSKVI